MKKSLLGLLLTISASSYANNMLNDVRTIPIAKAAGGGAICAISFLYGALVGPLVTIFGVVDGFDGQVVAGPLITTTSFPVFYLGYRLLKSGINDLDNLEKEGAENPVKQITLFLQEKCPRLKN